MTYLRTLGPLERISILPQEDHGACEMEKSQEVLGLSFPPRRDAAKLFEPSEESFDFPPTSVAAQRPSVLRPVAGILAGSFRRDEFDVAFFGEALRVLAAVPGLVGDQSRGQLIHECSIESSARENDVVSVARTDSDSEWKTIAVCERHDLGCLPGTALPDLWAPLFAGT